MRSTIRACPASHATSARRAPAASRARSVLAEDPSRFSIACRQVGPIALPDKLPREENVFSESTSVFFKNTKVVRIYDAKRNTLVYVAISRKVIEGSPMNAISTVPVQRW